MHKDSPAAGIPNPESPVAGHAIYTGSFAALENRWIDAVTELQHGDPLLGVNVLVGSNILATYLKRRYARTGRALANVRFLNFLDLAHRLAGTGENTEGKLRLPGLGNSIILEDILASRAPSIYAPLTGFPGFREALLETFRDLRDAGIPSHELFRVIDAASGMRDRRPHLKALAELYREFRERVELYRDVDDDFHAAVRNAPEARRLLGSRQLLVYGIYDATGQQNRLLSALANAFDMVYFIPWVDEAISEFVRPFLQARIRELGAEPDRLEEKSPVSSLDLLAARGHGLTYLSGMYGGNGLPSDGSVALVSAPGESRAAVEIVREIFQAVRDGAIGAFHEAAVILRQPEIDIPILREALRLRGVPYFIHGGSSFADRPLGRAVLAVCSLESNAYSREAILTAMELVAASLPEASAADWDAQAWRQLTNKPRFLAGAQSWDEGTEELVQKTRRDLKRAESPEAEIEDDEDTGHGRNPVQTFENKLKAAESLRVAWWSLRSAAENWPSSLAWKDWADFLNQRLEPVLGLSGDWLLFSSALDEIGNLRALDAFKTPDSSFESKDCPTPGAQLVPIDRMKGALKQALSSLSFPEGRFQRSGVNLLSTGAARGLRFPLVIIPGLDEGRFPAKLRQDPLLLDSERRQLRDLPIKSRRIEEERLLFDMAARSAEKRLVLLTSRLDESSDRERIPSQFFLRAAAVVRGGAVTLRDLADVPGFRSVSLDNPAPAANEVAVDEGEIRLRLITADRNLSRQALKALEHREPSRIRKPLAYDQARWNPKLTEYDGCFADRDLVQWAGGRLASASGQVSASRLEEYAKCPYLFFLRRVVELPVWEDLEPAQAMDPLERGTAIHAILERFLRIHGGEAFRTASEEELKLSLALLAKEVLEKSRPAGIPDLLWKIETDALLEMLGNWLEFERARIDEDLLPVQFEQIFGKFRENECLPAYRIQTRSHTFDFRGKMDRIDVSRDGRRARVVDYKTGIRPESMAGKKRTLLMSGERIQVAVYGGALPVLDEFKSVRSVEGEYLHLQPKDGRTVSCGFTAEELPEAVKRLPDLLEIIGNGIKNGAFFIRTSGTVHPGGHCAYCDFLMICGKDREQREERKSDDSKVREFLKILEPPQ